jgi:hypothetical protein
MTKLIASFALVVIVALGLNAQIKSKFSATAHDFLEQSCAVAENLRRVCRVSHCERLTDVVTPNHRLQNAPPIVNSASF